MELPACFCTTGEIGEKDEACSAANERMAMHNRNRAVGRLRWIAIVIMLVVMFLGPCVLNETTTAKEAKKPSGEERVTII